MLDQIEVLSERAKELIENYEMNQNTFIHIATGKVYEKEKIGLICADGKDVPAVFYRCLEEGLSEVNFCRPLTEWEERFASVDTLILEKLKNEKGS